MKALAVFLIMFFLVYLTGSFAAADFNIANWGDVERALVGIAGFMLGMFAAGAFMGLEK
jgi:hypothetical protein